MKVFPFLLAAAIVFMGLSHIEAQNDANYLMSATEFSQKIDKKGQILLDVRTPSEYESGHLANSINIDWNGSDFDQQISKLDSKEAVYIYCLSGGRSHTAAEKMRSKGFTVYEMEGGILQWRKAGLPEVVGEKAPSTNGLTLKQFEDLTKSHPYVLIDFNAPWCGPCKKMKPYIEQIEKDMKGELKVIYINTDNNKELAKALKIYSIPYLQLYRNGKMKWENMGLTDKKYLTQVVNDFR